MAIEKWTIEKKNELRRIWCEEDASATEIAARLGTTRNAILGQIHRMGLSNKRGASAKEVAARAVDVAKRNLAKQNERNRQASTIARLRKGNVAPKLAAEKLPPASAPPPVGLLNIAFMARRPDQCSWISGAAEAHATCCGHAVVQGTSWCAYHRSIVYQPAAQRIVSAEPRYKPRTRTNFGALRFAS